MLRITNTAFSMISCEKSQQLKSTTELMKIKERIEKQTDEDQHRHKETIAEMFLAGPLAWPDFPDYEDVLFEEDDEEWIPLDFDSSSGE